MRVKDGVNLDRVHWLLFMGAAVAGYLVESQGWGELTITSGTDGGDSYGAARVSNSLHPVGGALDLRTRDLPGGSGGEAAQWLASALQSIGVFDVVLEVDHLHIELNRATRGRA